MAEPHHNTNMFRPPFNPSAVLAPPAHPTLSENAPIDQFIQSGADGSSYYPGYATPSEHDYFSLFADNQQQPPPMLGKTGLAPTYSTTAVPPDALNANRKRKKDGVSSNGTGTAPTKKAAQSAAAKKTKKQQQAQLDLSDEEDDLDVGAGDGTLPERERRLLKNRKAAQQFRKRQKNHILELEARVETLSTENSTLTSQVELLHAENKLIREQLDYMRSFVLNALQFTFPPGGMGGGMGPMGAMAMHDLQKSMIPPDSSRP
ncbi:bZIP transcription factor domain containing protein [Acanthamoeba castellanii str. Neff]|uniref:BZIP transcription factor domain containing protein n=1 Tax=Acanthamoeba castellanii (strain ATCC 30010 / Neff) TaxID=1257118 RepID=L8GW57_ACACF|nr:bZIP transcription factor domain containing protein [Acanthamoeba castellanii str. Neff]ELR16326.1 bZIP transcription factor domain containing protein [Acanthamoeba castellanii str. Neff]